MPEKDQKLLLRLFFLSLFVFGGDFFLEEGVFFLNISLFFVLSLIYESDNEIKLAFTSASGQLA